MQATPVPWLGALRSWAGIQASAPGHSQKRQLTQEAPTTGSHPSPGQGMRLRTCRLGGHQLAKPQAGWGCLECPSCYCFTVGFASDDTDPAQRLCDRSNIITC